MKKLTAIALLLISMGIKAQNEIRLATQYNVSGFAENCLKDLKVSGVFVSITDINYRLASIYDGQTRETGPGCYAIFVNCAVGFDEYKNILAHELVHVWQYENGLKVVGTSIVFNNVNYESIESKHYDRPHEKQAREKGEALYKKFRMKY